MLLIRKKTPKMNTQTDSTIRKQLLNIHILVTQTPISKSSLPPHPVEWTCCFIPLLLKTTVPLSVRFYRIKICFFLVKSAKPNEINSSFLFIRQDEALIISVCQHILNSCMTIIVFAPSSITGPHSSET